MITRIVSFVWSWYIHYLQVMLGFRVKLGFWHLGLQGIFVFDGWFGPAVLAQKPEERCHEYHEGENIVGRKVTPFLDPIKQSVAVHFDVSVNHNGQTIKQIQEDHIMRFMFVQEMAFVMETASLKLVHYCPFLEPGGHLTSDTWNVTFAACIE